MKFLFPFLLLVFILSTSCDEGSFSWESNPPEVRLVVLNESDLIDKAIGDSIYIELGLELYNMQDLYFLDFQVYFDHIIFSPNENGFNYEFFPSFFSTSGDPITIDINSNGILDEDDEYLDINANGIYDPPVPHPIGSVEIDTTVVGIPEQYEDENGNNQYDFGENFEDENGNLAWDDGLEVYFDGGLGIPSPENNGGNAWGTGRVCEFYLSGILTSTIFNVDIIKALEFQEEDALPEEHSINGWDIYPLVVGSPHDPVLRLQQENQSNENSITISLQIDDAPKISKLKNMISYDPNVLSYSQYEILDYFDQTNYQVDLLSNDNQGEISLEFTHNIVNNNSLEVDDESFSQGFGGIVNVTFIVSESDSIATITLPESSISAESYNLNEALSYPLDLNYWTIEESLEVNF